MGWRREYWNPWPGHGPWSYLPPWMRPGWVLWLGYRGTPPVYPYSATPTMTREAEIAYLENLKAYLQDTLKYIEDRLNQLKSSK
ncbi:hypothetical protein Desfe_1061 [Desulfurococcus amylolyticus DSM 16532]|uniref:DUF5320 domain-containing protein n=1 Tax=Desulfurococcus amylolyticus DSM 16532 TaxID=768672 RepID=I3XSL0_DESAM|nr:hypothetical protein Desfe_1061 [Desulfurococcus amylolyticus DSM 16532]